MKTFYLFLLLIAIANISFAQPNNQDCLGSIPVCNGSYSNGTSYTGTGNIADEINSGTSCLASGEKNDVWYVFTAQNTDNIGFTITPNNSSDDYDWALFDLTNATCSDVYNDISIELSCNYSADAGATGAVSGGNGSSQGASGTAWNSLIHVVAGGTYVINVSNYSSTQYGYTINFTGSAGTMVDNSAPYLDQITSAPACGQSQITFDFTERVLCSSVSASDFTVTGPGGTYSITNINCNSGATYSQSFTITLNTALTSGGTYSLNLTGQVDDACGNTVNGNSLSFAVSGVDGSASVTHNVDCYGGNNGTATASATGGTTPYTYHWSTGALTAGVTGLSATSYTVTVTDNLGVCQDVITVTPTQPTQITSTISSTQPACNGGATGSATITPSNGTPGYTYHWSNGVNAQSISNVIAGTYNVSVYDSHSCLHTNSVTISQPAALAVGTPTNTQPSCYGGNNGQIALPNPTGGTAPYSYTWSPSGSGQTATGLSAGTYNVTIQDSHGCQSIKTGISLTQPTQITSTISSTQPACNGGATGGATITPSNGTPGYTYHWSNGVNAQSISNVIAGTYNVSVYDSQSCLHTNSVTISQPAALAVGTHTNTQPSCYGGNNGQIALPNPTGGTSPYTYTWSPSGSGQTATGLSAGTYNVTIQDSHGCQSIKTGISLTQPTQITNSNTIHNATCNGSSTGSIVTSASGGTAPLSYLWSANTGGQTSATAINLPAGSYNVTITDGHGCTIVNNSIAITQDAAIVITTNSINDASCGHPDGSATVSASGGSTTGFTYAWEGGQTGPTISNVIAGSYDVTVTDSHSCTNVTSVNINDAGAPTIAEVAPSHVNVLCFGNNTGSATVNGSGGTGTLTYSWSNGSGNVTTANNLTEGTYTVSVTDANLCVATVPITITQPEALSAIVSTTVNPTCFGSLNGQAGVTVSGGVTTYSYSWNSIPAQTTSTATGLSSDNYTVTITDNNGCTLTKTVTLTQPAAVSISGTSFTQPSCNGGNTGTATVNSVSGGTSASGNYNYTWSTTPGQNGQTAVNLSATIYTVTVSDDNSCTTTTSVTLTQPTAVSSTISSVQPLCNAGTNGTATVVGSGGTSPYTYLWDSNAGSQANGTATNLFAGINYFVTISDANNCSTINNITLTQPAVLAIDAITPTMPLCYGGNNGQLAIVNPHGGTLPYSYTWSPSGSGQTATGLSAGTYAVTVQDGHGCQYTQSGITLSQPSQIINNNTITNLSCNGNSTGSIVTNASGGTGTLDYIWAPGGQTSSNITNVSEGTYSLTITDDNGCTLSQTGINVTQPSALSISSTSFTQPLCVGNSNGTATVNATGGTSISGNYSYLWNTVPAQIGQTAVNLSATTYTVTVSDDNSCTTTTTITLTQPTVVDVTINSTNPVCFGDNNGSATATGTGGIGTFDYSWSNSQTTQTATNLIAAIYTVTATDDNGCTSSETVTLTEPDALTTSITAFDNVQCFGGNDGYATVTASGGTPNYDYIWDDIAPTTTASVTGLPFGTYHVTVTDAHNCTQISTATIGQPALLTVSSSSVDVLCNGGNTGQGNLGVAGGTNPYTFGWDNGSTNEDITDIAGTYNVTVTDNNGCTETSDVTINEPIELSATSTITNPNCGSNDGGIVVTPAGGVGSYTYQWGVPAGGGTISTASSLYAGTYFVTIADFNGCEIVHSATLSDLGSAVVSVSNIENIACYGDSTGSAQVNIVSGGTAPFSYTWYNNGNLISYPDTNIIDSLPAGSFSVNVLDINGCASAINFNILGNSSITAIMHIDNLISCYGLSDAVLSVTPSGGSGNYTYSWSHDVLLTDSIASNLGAGPYVVTITDDSLCTRIKTINLSNPNPITIALLDSTNVTCNGGNDGIISISPSGGTANFGYNYLWENGDLTNTADSLTAGYHSITVTDDNGCFTTDSFAISEPLPLQLPYTTTNSICGGNTGTITVNPNGGSAPYSFVWQDDAFLDTNYRDALHSGQYFVLVTDANGCSNSTSIDVIDNGAGTFNLISSTDAKCFGQATGEIIIGITGGTPDFIYVVSSGGNTIDSTSSSLSLDTISNLSQGTYHIIIYDNFNCITSGNVTVGEPTQLEISDTITNVSCFNGNNGSITINTNGGTPNYSYIWSNLDTTSTITNLIANNYSVTVYDNNLCEVTANFIVSQPTSPNTLTITKTDIDCFGNNSGISTASMNGGTSPYSYIWSNGYTDSTITGLSIGTYYVTVTDANNCLASDSVNIYEPTALNLSVTNTTNNKCYNDSTGAINVFVDGGTAPYQYNIGSENQAIGTFSGLTAGTYTVTVQDANGCTETISQTLANPSTLSLSDSIYYDNYYGNIIIVANGGTPNYTYNWSNGELFPTNNNLISGDYYITVTDANGCEYTNLYTIEIPLEIPSVITPNADGKNDIFRITNIESVSNVKINIFNRWGDLVFNYEGTGYNYLNSQWDGTFNGTELPMATYVYIVEVEINSEKTQYNGTVTIVR